MPLSDGGHQWEALKFIEAEIGYHYTVEDGEGTDINAEIWVRLHEMLEELEA